jgi:uncharacterized membrane protein YedE/YeeE
MRNLMALIAGGLFGAGLFTSGMTDTTKVQGWLDLFGDWDATLAFVLAGAILPMAIAWRFAAGRKATFLNSALPGTPSSKLGTNLILGSFIFGAGWGLSGLCPGPSMAALTYNGVGGLIFVAAMAAGMLAAPFLKPLIMALEAPRKKDGTNNDYQSGRA